MRVCQQHGAAAGSPAAFDVEPKISHHYHFGRPNTPQPAGLRHRPGMGFDRAIVAGKNSVDRDGQLLQSRGRDERPTR